MSDVTHILEAVAAGDARAANELLPLVYDELRKLAAARLATEKPGQTLQATALVHEAYLRLVGDQRFDHRGHFFAAAAEAMRRVLVENARRKASLKRGGGFQRVADAAEPAEPDPEDDVIALDDALTKLSAVDSLAARVVELRHFAGLGHEQIAETLDITVYLARQKWTYARAWLRAAIAGE
jgi:RNA polymerase sigma factor (TIGR02999 family)